MVVEIAASRETLSTYLTLVWFLTAVYPTVCVEWAGGAERLRTHVTDVGLFTCKISGIIIIQTAATKLVKIILVIMH